MIGIHESRLQEYLDDGYVEVKRNRFIWMADPKKICLRQMRTGLCQLDKDHHGRCSTVTFCCDGCGKYRRGSPKAQAYDVDGVADAAFCFLCVKGWDNEWSY